MSDELRANDASPSPRILFITRRSNSTGIVAELTRRSVETWFCPHKNREAAPEGVPVLTLAAALRLRRAVRAGQFDLVISFDTPEAWWKNDKPFLNNLVKAAKKILFQRRTLGIYLVPWILAGSGVPLAVFDWDDNTIISRKNWPLLQRATCYFKTQTPRNPYKAFLFQDQRADCVFNIVRLPHFKDWALKLRPHCVGVTLPAGWTETPAPEKTTDVFFAGALHYSWARQEGFPLLEQLRDEGYRIDLFPTGPGQFLPENEFLRRCAQAWLVWSPEGAGWDCARHYWAPLLGSVPLLNDPDTRRHQPLREGVHAVYYQVEGDDLKRAVRAALEDKPRLRAMAAAGAELVRRHHTHAALADYMIAETLRTAAAAKPLVEDGG